MDLADRLRSFLTPEQIERLSLALDAIAFREAVKSVETAPIEPAKVSHDYSPIGVCRKCGCNALCPADKCEAKVDAPERDTLSTDYVNGKLEGAVAELSRRLTKAEGDVSRLTGELDQWKRTVMELQQAKGSAS